MPKLARNGRITLGSGANMDYATIGHGPKKLIVLPGLSDGLMTVKGKAALLTKPYKPFKDEYTVYMFSRRGPIPEGFSIKDMADDQAEALDMLGIARASVLGVSQGGMIAQCFAADHRAMIEKLVIAVSAPRVNELIKENVTGWMEMAGRGDHRSLMTDTAEKGYSEAHLAKYRKLYLLLGHLGKPASYDRFIVNAKAILGFDMPDLQDRINCPTLIIGGTEDKTVGAGASLELHEAIKGSRLYMYEGLGHAAYEEAGDFSERVFAFLCE